MARLPRYFAPNCPQHVILRGNNRDPVFVSDDDYVKFAQCLGEAARDHGVAIHAYVFMTNHIHLLATPATETALSKGMQSLGRKYVQYFNYTYQRTGTLWEGRYKATVVDAESYLLTCMRYIELNPVRAGMVEHPGDYRWSSYRAHAQGEPDALLTPHLLYRRLGRAEEERQAAYRQLFRAQLAKADLDAIREATNKAWALGNGRFREKIEALSGRRAAPLPKGRPKRDENRV
ncbi:MAG: transposase [Burkholderiales bacterium]|nr:transposase [Burkholderiales bacterium]